MKPNNVLIRFQLDSNILQDGCH